MVILLIDANFDGHAKLLEALLGGETWRDMRDHIGIRFLHFQQVGLDRSEKDDIVWRLCQANGYYLLTDNRNSDSEDSLEATIRREGTSQSLPVFTVADADRVYQSADYRDRVVQRLLEYLLDAENLRGAARLFLP